ncbi:RagB/SusD family nutrient uptake outer membrane protein [Gemmatimonas sp.]|uniref:RagB/SusD family nutrient uptake outer membrane protein n=1 Tax=Gemmatimonas sp. TaxID=1962908 RepID=UPI00286D4E5B|nr:RagB/SusD family nutrient uptake outer membrane protein [Gemmatimonas sp.]
MRMIKQSAALAAAISLGACNLDLQNPNSPTESQVITNVDGVIGLATGLQSRFATSYGNYAYTAGLVTDEFAATSAALISISDAEQGAVPPGTGIADAVFNSVYRTVRTADELLAGADALAAGIDPGTRSGLKALAWTLKAEALGEALQSYQRSPMQTFGVAAPTYENRTAGLAVVRALLDSAAATITTTAPSPFFNNSILTPGVSLPNVIQLYRARYARMANDQATALAASNLVARTGTAALSVLTFPAPTVNPYANVTGGVNGIAVRRSFRTSMLPQDQRFAYFVTPSTTLTGRVGAQLDPFSRWANPQAPLPVYMPDEALLIKAEALAVQGNLVASQAVLDSVRTDCPGGRGLDDPKACLPALTSALTQPELLTEIYMQRRYELLGTGQRWEDSRRRGAIRGPTAAPAVPVQGQRCWLPYAFGDRNANPNATFAALPDPTEPSTFPASCQVQ